VAATHDGLLLDLQADPVGMGLALLALAAAGVAGWLWVGWCVASPVMLVLALVAVDRARGNRRVRVTQSKLLIEDTRPVRGFLIGPSRNRVTWAELESSRIEGETLTVRAKDGREVVVASGVPGTDLAELVAKIERAQAAARTRAP
jgi:hypothetical protein